MTPMEVIIKSKKKIYSFMIIAFIMLSCFATFSIVKIEVVKAGASPTDFTHNINLTVKNSMVSGTHTDFPVLVYDTGLTQLNGLGSDDFTFFNATDIEMDWELVNWDDSTDTLEAWVRFNLTGGVDYFFLYYEDTSDVADSDGGEHNPTAVWDSDFIFVYHMDDSDGSLDDSTSNNNDAIEDATNGVDAADYGQTGKVGDCVRGDGQGNDGDAQHFSLPDNLQTNGNWGTGTWSCWYWANNTDEDSIMLFEFQDNARYNFMSKDDSGTAKLRIAAYDGAWQIAWADAIVNQSWQFCVGRAGGDIIWAYRNMTYVTADSLGTIGQQSIGNELMGNQNDDYGLDGGLMDEAWLSSSNRSEDWIQTIYDMTNNGSGFLWWNSSTTPSYCHMYVRGNASSKIVTLQGERTDTVYCNNTGAYYETIEFYFTINGTDYFERLTVNVSDITDTIIDGHDIAVSFDDDNSSWSHNWHTCSNGVESIIVNGTTWTANNWMSGTNPFTADGDSDGENEIQASKGIFMRIRIIIPNDATYTTHTNAGMTWDCGEYS